MTLQKKIIIPAAVSSQLDDSGRERIHMANRPDTFGKQAWIPPVVPQYVFAGIDSSENLLRSMDGGLTWPDEIPHGGLTGLALLANGNSRITRFQSLQGRTSVDGSTFVSLTGNLSGTGFPMWSLWTGDEWLWRSVGGLRYSADGVDYQVRTIPNIGIPNSTYTSVAKLGSNIISTYVTSTLNRLLYSSDNGATFSIVNTGTAQNYTSLVATSDRFLAFRGASGLVDMSMSGAEGTWTLSYADFDTPNPVIASAYSPELNRIVVKTGTPASFHYSDDNGLTWNGPYFLPIGTVGFEGKMIYVFGKFISIDAFGGNTSAIHTSTDGVVWETRYTKIYSSVNFLTGLAGLET